MQSVPFHIRYEFGQELRPRVGLFASRPLPACLLAKPKPSSQSGVAPTPSSAAPCRPRGTPTDLRRATTAGSTSLAAKKKKVRYHVLRRVSRRHLNCKISARSYSSRNTMDRWPAGRSAALKFFLRLGDLFVNFVHVGAQWRFGIVVVAQHRNPSRRSAFYTFCCESRCAVHRDRPCDSQHI
jgi:hypothetical protein